MAPKLYMIEASPPVRSVLLTAKALDIDLELIRIDLSKGEHYTPEYLKLNPQHTVPTLDDDGLILCDSHAIITYLVEQYAKGNPLYPDDICKRALINQRLQFNCGVLFTSLAEIMRPLIFEKQKDIPSDKIVAVRSAYEILEKFLAGQKWMAGNNVTLADFSLIATITSCAILVPIDEKKFPNIAAWIKRMKGLPYYEVNQTGVDMHMMFIKEFLNSK